MTFMVVQGHCYRISVISQNFKRSRDHTQTSPLGVSLIYHACTSTPQCQKVNLHANFEMHSFTHFQIYDLGKLKWVM